MSDENTNPSTEETQQTAENQQAEPVTETKQPDFEAQLAAANDKYLRLYSEFDNFRKRTQRERLELLQNASADVIKSLLPVLDDFERAIRNNEKATDIQAINEGVQLVYNKFKGILTRNGLEPMDSAGEVFDVDKHEAITNIPAPSEDLKGKVVDEVEKGYSMNGKVIRFAKVVVGN
jgi:molecular chaperone GrpE